MVITRSNGIWALGFMLLVFLSVQAEAQQSAGSDIYQATMRGIALYEAGDFEQAASILKPIARKTDSVKANRYLGLSMERLGQNNDALKAHEKAVKVTEKEVNIALRNSTAPEGLIAALLQETLEKAAASATDYIRLNQKLSGQELQRWTERAARFDQLVNAGKSTGLRIYSGTEVDTKAKILLMPKPGTTESAQRERTMGKVVLLIALGDDGNVKLIVPIKTLPDGLTKLAVEAARKIKFIPASKDGAPVHTKIQVEYHFSPNQGIIR